MQCSLNRIATLSFTLYFKLYDLLRLIIRFQLYDVESLMVDSGDIYDTSYNGGRVGVYQFGQKTTLWSDLKVQCLSRENKALYLDGVDDHVELTNISSLDIYKRYTCKTCNLHKY